MKIEKLHLQHLHNGEHLHFMTKIKELIAEREAKKLDLEALFPKFLAALEVEDEAYQVMRVSAATKELESLDQRRDTAFSILRDQIKILQRHFSPPHVQAAYRLSLLMGTYGNLSEKNYQEETAGLHSLVGDLRGVHLDDLTYLSLEVWVDELDAANQEFDQLLKTRYTESRDRKAITTLRSARYAIDEIYRQMMGRVNAGAEFHSPDKYEDFISQVNIRIDRNKELLAQRKGINAKKN